MSREARETLRATLGSDPWELIAELEAAAERKGRAAGEALRLEKLREVMIARIQSNHAKALAHEGKPPAAEAKLKRIALASDEYTNHIIGLAAAIEEKELAEGVYWTIRAKLEWEAKAVSHYNALTRMDEAAGRGGHAK